MPKQVYVHLECDYCHGKLEFPTPQAPTDKQPTADEVAEVKRWIALQLGDATTQVYCRPLCVRNAMEVQPPPEGKIELVSA